MTTTASASAGDRALSRRIVALMRWGTLAASILLVGAAVLTWAGMASAASVAGVAGSGAFILLPLLRLLLMLSHFGRRTDRPYLGITALVIVLVLTSAITGMLL